jgi:RNA polymerase sigma-70 factor (ECF subfamily)
MVGWDDATVEDLLQEVFIGFLAGAPRITNREALRAYLMAIAAKKGAQELRRRKIRRWVTLSSTGELPEQPLAPADSEGRAALQAFSEVLDTLSTRRRMLFVLRHIEGLEVLDAARAVSISESTARRELNRARADILRRAKARAALSDYVARLPWASSTEGGDDESA